MIRFYCETCEAPVCILCTFNDHKEHDVAQFSDAVMKYKSNIENLMKDCQENLHKFQTQIETLEKCESCIKQAEAKIRDVAIDMISDIRNRLVISHWFLTGRAQWLCKMVENASGILQQQTIQTLSLTSV